MRLLSDMRRVLLLGGLLSAGLVVAPAARAAPATAQAPEVARLEAECARLRTELQRANADVAALKRERGVRNDYRLRQRMADAEALARKLTEAEAQLRSRTGATPAPKAPSLAPPTAEPGDGPVELEAKADLLSDQARRLAAQAEDLARTAGQLRGRQTLRKRANQLERDPFASMEGSKRSLVFGGSSRLGSGAGKSGNNESTPTSPTPTTGGGNTSMDSSSRGGGAGGSSGSGGSAAGPTTGSPAPMGAQPGAAPPPTAPPTQMPTPTAGGAEGSKGADFTATPPQPTNAISTQVRTLLDPATLSEVQRLERTGKPVTDPEALEKLAAALRQRAQALDAQSKSLRARAKP